MSDLVRQFSRHAAAARVGRSARPTDVVRRWWRAASPTTRRAIGVAAVVALAALPWYQQHLPLIPTTGTDFLSVLAGSVVPFVLMALGLNVVVGMAGLLDLGYVGFFATGAYTVGVLTSRHASLPWLLAMVAAVLVSMVFGVVLGAPTLRLRGDYLAIVTLGFGEIIRITAKNSKWLGAAEGISNIKRPPSFGPVRFTVLDNRWYWVFGFALILGVSMGQRLLETSRVGRAWNAIREDEDAAEMMGVPTFTFKLWAFAIGASIGGLAGAFYAGKLNTIYPSDFEVAKSVLFIAAIVLGGIGNRWGAILGAFLIAYLPERFRFVAEKRTLLFGVVLLAMVVFRPQGLLPRRADVAADGVDSLHGADDPADGADDPADGADDPADGADDPADGADDPADGIVRLDRSATGGHDVAAAP